MRTYIRHSKKILLIVLVFLLTSTGYAQITSAGKDFWFNFMSNSREVQHDLILKIFISSDKNASGTVSVPGKSWSKDFSVTANSTTTIIVPSDIAHVLVADAVANQGVHITSSDEDINVFAMNTAQNTTDGSLILPVTALGSSYYIMAYEPVKSNGECIDKSEFSIVAIDDNTTVWIIPKNPTTGGHPAGTPYSVTLGRGMVYQVQADKDLTGSRVYASGKKKIAVFGGASCAFVPPDKRACDHLFEQMYPNNTLRRNFIAIPFKTRKKGDTYRVLAIRNGTSFSYDGNTFSLNAGEWVEFKIDKATYISSNYPIAVAQYSNGSNYDDVANADPFFIMLSPIEQTREDITFEEFRSPTITKNFLNIAAKTSCTSQIKLDGTPVTGWKTVDSKPTYSYVQLSVSQGVHRLTANDKCGFNAYVYGYGPWDSYGYSAGVRLDTLAIKLVTNTDCAGHGTEFYVSSYPYPITNYHWDFGDGATSTEEKPVHVYEHGGDYSVTLIVTYDNKDRDTVIQNFKITEAFAHIGHTGGICGSKTVQFSDQSTVINGSAVAWNWDFGDGGSSNFASPSHTYVDYGSYQVILRIATKQGCMDIDTAWVTINPLHKIELGRDVDVCLYESVPIGDTAVLGAPPYRYSWSPTTGLSATNTPFVDASPLTTTKYYLTVLDSNDCPIVDSITVVVLPLPEPKIIPEGPVEICSCDSVRLDAGNLGYIVYEWSNGDTTQTTLVREQGDYTVTVTDTNGCVNTSPAVTVNVIHPQATITLGNSSYQVRPGEYITIPLLVTQAENLDRCNSHNFELDLVLSKYIVVPVNNTSTGLYEDDMRRIHLTGTRDSNSDTLLLLQFMGTLGHITTSPVTIDEFYWIDCNFPTETNQSEVNLIGLCEEGGTTRLYRSPELVTSLIISPNPANGKTAINYTLGNDTPVKIFLTDIAASNTVTLFEGFVKKGEHELIFDAKQFADGSYLLVIQTPDGTVSTLMEVLK